MLLSTKPPAEAMGVGETGQQPLGGGRSDGEKVQSTALPQQDDSTGLFKNVLNYNIKITKTNKQLTCLEHSQPPDRTGPTGILVKGTFASYLK